MLCCDTRQETHDVKSFFFTGGTDSIFSYKPGQFITLEVPVEGKTIPRTYTISATPTRPYLISITVKRVPGGIISNHLHDWLEPGKVINATAPGGKFTFLDYSCRDKLLFLSGGSGITPLMSMSRYLLDLRHNRDLVFSHSARTPEDVIFAKELEMMELSLPSFQTCLFCDCAPTGQKWDSEIGFLSPEALSRCIPDICEREVFCCGPKPYMDNACKILKELNYDMRHYHQESFTFETLEADAPAQAEEPFKPQAAQEGVKTYKVVFKKFNKTVDCPANTTVLTAGRESGLPLPFGCAQGICGTCKTRMLSGKADMNHQGGIRQSEVDQGYILPCCSLPLSDLELE